MQILINIIIVIIMAIIANKKGFNPWLWILAGGVPGFIILLCMPSAAAPEVNEVVRKRRRNAGNATAGMIGVTAIAFIIGLRLWLNSK